MKISLQKGNLGLSLEVERLEGKELDFILGVLRELAKPEYGPLIPMIGIDGMQLKQPAPCIEAKPWWGIVPPVPLDGYVQTTTTTLVPDYPSWYGQRKENQKLCGCHYMVACNCLKEKGTK